MHDQGYISLWALSVAIILAVALASIWGLMHQAPQSSGQSAQNPSAPIENHYELTAEDNGKTFTYPLTSRFSVILDSNAYDVGALTCTPAGILGPISNIPSVPAPLAAARFEVVSAGTCTLTTGTFSATIVGTAR